MPLTPYKGFTPSQSQQFAAQREMDPANSPVAKLRNNPALAGSLGYDPMAIERQYQSGMAQVNAGVSQSANGYGSSIPSMRNNLMKLNQTRLQTPRFALPNTRAQY